MGWVERGVEGCRIDRKNESPSAIPQQKEDVVPPLVAIQWGSPESPLLAPESEKMVKKRLLVPRTRSSRTPCGKCNRESDH
jgi:hypothetical protein